MRSLAPLSAPPASVSLGITWPDLLGVARSQMPQGWRGDAVVEVTEEVLGKLSYSLILSCLERLEMSFWKVAARRKTLPLTLWSSG